MTKPLIAVIKNKQQQSRMFFWVKEAIAEEQPIVFTTPLERTTISSLTTIINSKLKEFPLDSADYRAMKLKEEISKSNTRNTDADLTVADLFDATNEKVIEAATSDAQINAVNALPKNEESSKIQTAAEALAGIDGYMVAGGRQCGPNSDTTCWIRYNFGKIGESSFRSTNKTEEIEGEGSNNKSTDNGSNNKPKKIKDGVPVENEKDNSVDTTPFSYVSHSDGTVTVSDFKFGNKIGSEEPPISFNALTVETVELNGETFTANPKYKGKHSSEVKFTDDKMKMYIVKAHSPEEKFEWSDEDIKKGTRTIKITNGDGKEETKTEECKKDIRCEDDATFTDTGGADPQIFKGEKFEIVMRTSGDYYAIAKDDPTEEFYYSGNMGPFAKKRDYRRGRYTKAGSEDKGFTYTFYGEGGVPVFKIVDCSKGENTNTATTAASTGDDLKCSSGYRAAGHMALANYDSFVFFNRDAADEIQKAWEKTETTSQE